MLAPFHAYMASVERLQSLNKGPLLDLTKPIWAKDRSVVQVLNDNGDLLHVRLVDPVGIVTHGIYHRDGRSTDPESDGRRDLTNERPREGRCISFGGWDAPRFHEDI